MKSHMNFGDKPRDFKDASVYEVGGATFTPLPSGVIPANWRISNSRLLYAVRPVAFRKVNVFKLPVHRPSTLIHAVPKDGLLNSKLRSCSFPLFFILETY